MKMIRSMICIAGACLAMTFAPSALAAQERDAIELVKAQVATQRQAVVAENLGLSAEESDVFWPLYKEFHKERDALTDKRIAILREFRDNFDGLSEDQAATIMKDYTQMEEDLLKLRKKYIKKFSKAMSNKTTLRYFQIENKIDAIIDFDLAQVVPLAQ